jgi:uncharacterized tellurite resistance protein B-like protein
LLEALLRLLSGIDDGGDQRDDPAYALAVLLIETARSDDRVETREKRIIGQVLARRFGLAPEAVTELVRAAEQGARQAVDLYHFTRVVVENFAEAERVGVIEMLWEVALADGELTGDEDALIRRVAGLIFVSDRDRGDARRRARERLAGK